MMLLPDRLPWYVAGPLIGFAIVALYALVNRPLGASGMYVEVMTFLRDRAGAEYWRVWYFVGVIVGAVLVAILSGNFRVDLGYGALSSVLPLPLLIPVLFVGGILIGYGARWAGGCTSGHGLCGVSVVSPGSIAASATFFGTAIAVSFALHLLVGGGL